MGSRVNVSVLKHALCNSTNFARGGEKVRNFITNFMKFYSFCHGAETFFSYYPANFLQFYPFCHDLCQVNDIGVRVTNKINGSPLEVRAPGHMPGQDVAMINASLNSWLD